MIQLNLIPDVKKQFLQAQRTKRMIMLISLAVSGAFVALVAMLAVYVYVGQSRHLSNVSNDIDRNIAALKGINGLDRILTVQQQLKALPGLHQQKPIVSRVFGFLTKMTPKEVKLDTLEMGLVDSQRSQPLTIKLGGKAKDFKAVNRYVDTIKNASYKVVTPGAPAGTTGTETLAFNKVLLESLTRRQGVEDLTANFSISLSFDPQLFSPLQSVELLIPSITSSVSSSERPTLFNTEEQP